VARIHDPRLQLLELKVNRGIGPAFNLGYEHAKGEWIGLLPADDRWQPDFIRRLLEVAVEKDCNLVGCWQKVIDASGGVNQASADLYEGANNHAVFDFADFSRFRFQNPLQLQTFLWKKSLLDRCMPMEERLIPCDWVTFLRTIGERPRGAIVTEKLCDYRWHGENLGATTARKDYMVHFLYAHLTAYRRTAQKLAIDADAELRQCHSEYVATVLQFVHDPAIQARLIEASECGYEGSKKWPDFASFQKQVVGNDLRSDLGLMSLEQLLARGVEGDGKIAELAGQLSINRQKNKERIVRLREELDRAKAKMIALKGGVDTKDRAASSRISRWISKLLGKRPKAEKD
jgi:hypothetical protein